ncbi:MULTISPECIES: L-fucose/L-arabinose isomerase family protein [Hungatella]|jgi:L-arabinose isomerase|uniref:L-fucose/L-arabinose isomerase family protein n=1 Tax=Hungatella TaxID=1649459 RepID=UPI0011DC99D3|nr:L-fucose/L-arabinose isomerase family protein [Hungatella hathewayi]
MHGNRKTRIGLLGLMTDGYEDTFPGILERQKRYAQSIVNMFSNDIELVFEEIGTNRAKIEKITASYNAMELDGILIVLLAYSQGAWLLKAVQNNRLPLAVAVLQTDDEVASSFNELDLTINQGIHGAQDNCNILMRLGIPYQTYAGSRFDHRFREFIEDFARAVRTKSELAHMRIGTMGRMQGMGDILTDEVQLFEKLGVEICHDDLGCIYSRMQNLQEEEIQNVIEADRQEFSLDEKLTEESHWTAIKEYLGFKRYLEDNHYDGFTAHFDMFGQDGRFRQLPLYAASKLMGEGYGYAAEGDVICAAMVRSANILSGMSSGFTEMYMMDARTESILFCHAGEGNYKTAAAGRKPKLIDRFLGEGGLENPPTVMFVPRQGRATLVSMVSVKGEKFRLVVAKGEILDREDLQRCEMPYFFFRPDSGVTNCVEAWLKQGGTHHEVICLGDIAVRWRMLCEMLEIEYVEV